MADEVEETNSGIKKKGDWKEVAEFGEEVEEVMKESADEQSVEKFEEWRPKEEEAENDMKAKTVDKAVINKNDMEKDSEGVKEDFRDASEEIAKAGKKAVQKEPPHEEVTKASGHVVKNFYSKAAKAFRKFEETVYSKIALKNDHYYLDTEDFSVDMKSRKDGDYQMDVNVLEDNTRKKLKKNFEDNE